VANRYIISFFEAFFSIFWQEVLEYISFLFIFAKITQTGQ